MIWWKSHFKIIYQMCILECRINLRRMYWRQDMLGSSWNKPSIRKELQPQWQHQTGKERLNRNDILREKSMALFDWLDLKGSSKGHSQTKTTAKMITEIKRVHGLLRRLDQMTSKTSTKLNSMPSAWTNCFPVSPLCLSSYANPFTSTSSLSTL